MTRVLIERKVAGASRLTATKPGDPPVRDTWSGGHRVHR